MSNQDHNNNNKSSDYQYLEKLEFRPELRKSFLNFFVTNFRVVILLIVLLTVWGVYSFRALPLESDPEVKIPIAVVMTTYPGASPADIEELVTKKVETEISSLKDIDKITSSSSNSVSSVTVEFNAKADLEESIRQLKDKVSNVEKDLPTDANDPVVREISVNDQPIFSVSLAGPYDGFSMRKFAEDIQEELEKIPGVREVSISGGDEREFEIAYDPAKLSMYKISAEQANLAVKAGNLAIPGGNFSGAEFNYSVRTDARFFDTEHLGNIPLFHGEGSSMVYLRDVAAVQEKAIKKTVYSRFSREGNDPQNSVTIQIVKKTGGSIVEVAETSKEKIDELLKTMPAGLHYDTTVDMADLIKENFDQLTHDFLLTIILVSVILFLIIGIKEAFVAGLAVPLVFFATFGVMLMVGISLNFLSMISLILALGLLVDDAIVVVSATKQYLRSGKFTPEEAVLLVLNDFKVVLTTTTLTTVWAFLPLLLSSGIMGEYIKSIPITVSVTLLASLAIALLINHPLAAVLERIRFTRKFFFLILLAVIAVGAVGLTIGSPIIRFGMIFVPAIIFLTMIRWYMRGGKYILTKNKELMDREWQDDELIKKKLKEQGSSHSSFADRLMHGIISFDKVIPIYEKYLTKVLDTRKSRWKTLGVVTFLLIVAIAMPITGIVKSEFFPTTDSEYMFVNIEAPIGLRLEETNKIVTQVEEKLLNYPEITNFSTLVGVAGQGNNFGSFGGSLSHSGSITLRLVKDEKRNIKSYDLAEKMRKDLEEIEGAKVTVVNLGGGPPSGAAFEARIKGDDLETLDRVAHDLEPVLTSIPGVVNADISLKNSPADYTFRLHPEKMELYNLNAAHVGSMLRTAISGSEVTTILKDGEETKVMARFSEEKIPTLESIQNLQILNTQREAVYLRDVAAIELTPSVDSITRIDQKRAVLLSAGVSGTTPPAEVVTEFQKKAAADYILPEGYEIVYGGENEQNAESMASIMRAMVIALFLIISTLIIQFNSVRKTFIVLVTIPLALIGVFLGMAITGINLSFPGLIGVVALFGIVVKNAIILVDKINLNLKSGIEFKSAIIDAGKSRLEAIFITSICTIAGITPVTLSDETWTALGSAIIFGLMVSSFLTLFVVPTLFMMMVRDEENIK